MTWHEIYETHHRMKSKTRKTKSMTNTQSTKITFLGTPQLAVIVLNELKEKGITPDLIITSPDTPQGRKLILTPPPVKIWAQENKIEVLQPQKLRDESLIEQLVARKDDLYIVAAYGKIIPQSILDIPKKGTLNVHPSILPLFRGPAPIQYQILKGVPKVGVSIMLLDAKIDHGPILTQKVLPMPKPLPTGEVLEEILAHVGGKLLADILPQWMNGAIETQEQEHDGATFTQMIKKQDGLLNLKSNAEENYRKIKAFTPWPSTYFFTTRGDREIRVRVTNAELKNNELIITRVIPEGKKEMDYQDFLRG